MSEADINLISNIGINYTSPDANLRKQSEDTGNEIRNKSMAATSVCLLKIASLPNISEIVKVTSLVLLRKIINIDSKDKWEPMEFNHKEEIKKLSLELFVKEQSNDGKNKYIDVIGEGVDNTADFNETWDDLTLLTLSISRYTIDDINNNSLTLEIESLIKLISNSTGFLFEVIIEKYNVIIDFLCGVYKQGGNIRLKVTSSKGICELLAFGNKKENKRIREFIYYCLETTFIALNSKDEDNLITMLKNLIEIISYDSTALKKYSNEAFKLMYKITDSKELSEENSGKIKELAFEFIISVIEEKPSLVKKDTENLKVFGTHGYQYSFECNTKTKDSINNIEQDWQNPTETESFVEGNIIAEDNIRFVHNIIDRMSEVIDIQVLTVLLSEIIITLINKDDSLYKYIGLLSGSQVVCYTDDIGLVAQIFPFIFSMLKSENPKLRFASANCVDQLSSTFNPVFQTKYIDTVLPICYEVLKVEKIPRVQCQLLNAGITFLNVEEEHSQIFKKYARELFELLFGMLINPSFNTMVKLEMLKCINQLVTTIESESSEYAENAITILTKYYHEQYNKKAEFQLYSKIINCITLFGVYKEAFLIPALPNLIRNIIEIINTCTLIKNINLTNLRNDIQGSLGRLFTIIQSNDPSQIPLVVESILRGGEISTSGVNENSTSNNGIGSHSSELEDLIECTKLLDSVINSGGDAYINHIEITEKIVGQNINTITNHKLRLNLCEILGSGVLCFNEENHKTLMVNKGKLYLEVIIDVIKKEYENKTCGLLVNILNKIIGHICGLFTQSEMEKGFYIIYQFLEVYDQKRVIVIKKKTECENENAEKEEEEEQAQENDCPEDLITKENNDNGSVSDEKQGNDWIEMYSNDIGDIETIQENGIESIEYGFKSNKPKEILRNGSKFDNIFRFLISKTIPYLSSLSQNKHPLFIKYPNNLKLAALGIDNILEYFPITYHESVLKELLFPLFLFCSHTHKGIRQPACYGGGGFIKFSSDEIFNLYSKDIFESLKNAVNTYNISNNKDNEGYAIDNAVASIGKGIWYKGLQDQEFINIWGKYLPIKKDESEMQEQHSIVCDVLGKGFTKLTEEQLKMMVVIGCRVYKKKELSNTEVNNKIINIFKKANNGNDVSFNKLRGCIDEVYKTGDGEIKKQIEEIMKRT